MINDYRIEKDRLPVVIVTADGARMSGELFVQPYARFRMGPEEAPDIMNGGESFFPFAMEGGETVLIAKDHVREVELAPTAAAPDDLDPATGARRAMIEMTLVDGAVISGAVYLEVPFDRPRLLDFLNRFDRRFITLHDAGGTRLVNRRLIERVRPLD
ncbi:MAG: hypothetical protein ACJ79S_10690 [Gemmatimonadaceae bacterium]